MGRVKDYAVDLADELIDAAVQKVKKGYDRSKAIKDLLNDPAVRTFFDEVVVYLLVHHCNTYHTMS